MNVIMALPENVVSEVGLRSSRDENMFRTWRLVSKTHKKAVNSSREEWYLSERRRLLEPFIREPILHDRYWPLSHHLRYLLQNTCICLLYYNLHFFTDASVLLLRVPADDTVSPEVDLTAKHDIDMGSYLAFIPKARVKDVMTKLIGMHDDLTTVLNMVENIGACSLKHMTDGEFESHDHITTPDNQRCVSVAGSYVCAMRADTSILRRFRHGCAFYDADLELQNCKIV